VRSQAGTYGSPAARQQGKLTGFTQAELEFEIFLNSPENVMEMQESRTTSECMFFMLENSHLNSIHIKPSVIGGSQCEQKLQLHNVLRG